MSIVGSALGTALSTLGTVTGQPTLEYRAGHSGDWLSLPGAWMAVQESEPGYDDGLHAEQETQRAVLRVPEGGPTLERGYQVRRGESDSDIWAVHSGPSQVAQGRYQLTRSDIDGYGPDRGATRP